MSPVQFGVQMAAAATAQKMAGPGLENKHTQIALSEATGAGTVGSPTGQERFSPI